MYPENMKEIAILEQHFVLHPYGTAYWKERAMLLIADVHLGKTMHFRKNGMAVPLRSLHKAFEKMEVLLEQFQPKTLCFLGDLFHSHKNTEYDLFREWIEELRPASMILVTGNHDIIPETLLKDLGLELCNHLTLDNILLTHEPEETPGRFNICGHLHPGIRLKGPGKQSLKLPCFYQKPQQLILPAFGEFTGNYLLRPRKKDRVFAVTPEEVILLEN